MLEAVVRLRSFVVLAAVASVVALTEDISVTTLRVPGGAVMGASLVEQVDGQTFRIDLGPAKGNEARGVVVVHANRFTRFNFSAGGRGSTLIGSLDSVRLGSGLPLTVMLANLRPDGSYPLLELTTNTR
jgi:hypothetical protein